jgi:hypothetical protein
MVGRGTRADRKLTGLEGNQTSPHRLKLREATSGKPGGFVGQAAL